MSSSGQNVPYPNGQTPVLIERIGNVLLVTINRPESANTVNLAVTVALGDVLEAAEHDSDVRVIIITGSGDRSFCAGADLKALARGEKLRADDPTRAAWGFAGYVNHPISKPTIAAVNGFALGGGTEIALASDLVVASDTASFGLPEVTAWNHRGGGRCIPVTSTDTPKDRHGNDLHRRRAVGRPSAPLGSGEQGRPVSAAPSRSVGTGRADLRQRAAGRAGQQTRRVRNRWRSDRRRGRAVEAQRG